MSGTRTPRTPPSTPTPAPAPALDLAPSSSSSSSSSLPSSLSFYAASSGASTTSGSIAHRSDKKCLPSYPPSMYTVPYSSIASIVAEARLEGRQRRLHLRSAAAASMTRASPRSLPPSSPSKSSSSSSSSSSDDEPAPSEYAESSVYMAAGIRAESGPGPCSGRPSAPAALCGLADASRS